MGALRSEPHINFSNLLFLLNSQGCMVFPVSLAAQLSWWTVTKLRQGHEWANQQGMLEKLPLLENRRKASRRGWPHNLFGISRLTHGLEKNFEKWASFLYAPKTTASYINSYFVVRLKKKKRFSSLFQCCFSRGWFIFVVSWRWYFWSQFSFPASWVIGTKLRTCGEVVQYGGLLSAMSALTPWNEH